MPNPVRLPSPVLQKQSSPMSSSASPTDALLPAGTSRSPSPSSKQTAVAIERLQDSERESSLKKLRAQRASAVSLVVALGLPLLITWLAVAAHYSAAAIAIAFMVPSIFVICFLVAPVGPDKAELALPRETKAEQRNALQQIFDPAAKSAQDLRSKAIEMRNSIANRVTSMFGIAVQRCLPCIDIDEETLFPSLIQLTMGIFGLITAYSLLTNLHRVSVASALILGTCSVVQVQDCLGWILGELLGIKAVVRLRKWVNVHKDATEESCTKAADGLVNQARGLATVWGCLPSAERPLKRRRNDCMLTVLGKMDQIGAITRSSPLKCIVATLNLIVFFDSLRVASLGAFISKSLDLPSFKPHKLQAQLASVRTPAWVPFNLSTINTWRTVDVEEGEEGSEGPESDGGEPPELEGDAPDLGDAIEGPELDLDAEMIQGAGGGEDPGVGNEDIGADASQNTGPDGLHSNDQYSGGGEYSGGGQYRSGGGQYGGSSYQMPPLGAAACAGSVVVTGAASTEYVRRKTRPAENESSTAREDEKRRRKSSRAHAELRLREALKEPVDSDEVRKAMREARRCKVPTQLIEQANEQLTGREAEYAAAGLELSKSLTNGSNAQSLSLIYSGMSTVGMTGSAAHVLTQVDNQMSAAIEEARRLGLPEEQIQEAEQVLENIRRTAAGGMNA